MPEAIATTKRKFYKALDSLNQVPSTNVEERNGTLKSRPVSQPVVKRVRRSTSNGSTIGQPLQVTYVPRSSIEKSLKDEHAATHNDAPSNFSPWSHDAFLTRLKTFSNVSLWHSKPEAVSEVAWAKRGWTCIDVDTVACRGGCDKRVVVDFAPLSLSTAKDMEDGMEDTSAAEEAETFESSLIARYEDLIITGHSGGCLWRRSGCQDDIYHLQVVRPAIWQPALSHRFASVMNVKTALQQVKVRGMPAELISSPSLGSAPVSLERLAADLPPSLLPAAPDTSDDSRRTALEIALHGWQGSSASGSDLLTCGACFQRIGLWMYQPGYRSLHRVPSDASADSSHEGQDGADDDDTGATIDLLEMHREHCPWRNAQSQKASGNLQGLNAAQILRRVVTTHAREQRRRSEEESDRSTMAQNGDSLGLADVENEAMATSLLSKEEIALQDKQRESRLRKLKNLFRVKRREPGKAATASRPTSLIYK